MKDIQDYLDELEDSAWNHEDSYKISRIRNKIDEWITAKVPRWNKLIFRQITDEEERIYGANKYDFTIENLPDYDKDVLVTNGKYVWVDSFDIYDGLLYLSGTDNEVNGVIAWMEIPGYKL